VTRETAAPAEDAEGLEADAHEVEERSAAERKQHQDRRGDAHGPESHAALVLAGRSSGEPGEQRNQRHRFNHHEKDHEEFQRLAEHLMLCAKSALPGASGCHNYLLESLTGEAQHHYRAHAES
jgi:hypothetical protein